MADITLKPGQSQMDPSKGRGIKGMESSLKRHEGKSSLAPDELLGAERADETSASLFSHRLLETRAVSVRTRGKNFIKICCGSLRCILQRSQTPRLIHTRLCKNSTCSRTGLLAAVRGLQSGSGSLFKLLPVHRSQKSWRDRKSTRPNALATSVPCPALPVCSCPLLHAEFPTSGSGECANFFKHVDKQDEALCVCVRSIRHSHPLANKHSTGLGCSRHATQLLRYARRAWHACLEGKASAASTASTHGAWAFVGGCHGTTVELLTGGRTVIR